MCAWICAAAIFLLMLLVGTSAVRHGVPALVMLAAALAAGGFTWLVGWLTGAGGQRYESAVRRALRKRMHRTAASPDERHYLVWLDDRGRAREDLAARGDVRRIWADPSGVTIGDALGTTHAPWEKVSVLDSERHVIVVTPTRSLAIPRRLGAPAAALVAYSRPRVPGT